VKNQPLLTSFPQTILATVKRKIQASLRDSKARLNKQNICGLSVFYDDVLPTHWLSEIDPTKRQRHFGMVPVFWAWCNQILEGNASCGRALSLIQSWYKTAGVSVPKGDSSSYCQARKKLDHSFLHQISNRILTHLDQGKTPLNLWKGLNLKAIDGSTVQLYDTPENQKEYPQPTSQKDGCGFPVMGIVGVCDLSHGGWLGVETHSGKKHDARMAPKLLKYLKQGDLLLADRAFGSYEFIARLQQQNVHSIMRLHQARFRKLDWRRGKKLSPIDRLVSWTKPVKKSPTSNLTDDEWDTLPATLTLRYVKVGYQNRRGEKAMLVVVTSLLDPIAYDGVEITDLYARRWEIEVKLRDLKTTLGMEKFAVKSPDMARKTLTVLLIAYNLVRLTMQRSAICIQKPVYYMSPKGTIDLLTADLSHLRSCAGKPRKLKIQREEMIELCATKLIDIRPYRSEPRAIKQRPKSYQFLTAPRHIFRESDTRSNHYNKLKKSA